MKKVLLVLVSLGVLSGCATPTGEVKYTVRNVIITDAYKNSKNQVEVTPMVSSYTSKGTPMVSYYPRSSSRVRHYTCMVLEEDTSYELCTGDYDIYNKVLEYGKNNSYKALIKLTEMKDMIGKSKYVKAEVLDIRLR